MTDSDDGSGEEITPRADQSIWSETVSVDGSEIDAQSLLPLLDAERRPAVGLKLADLAEETPLPELAMGPAKYRLLGELGAGGMGKVYLAYDQDLNRRVALKVVLELEPKRIRRFLEEAQVMAQLEHPNIVPVHEVGLSEGRPYYTMPVVRGRTLSDVIRKLRRGDAKTRERFSLGRRMQVFVEIGQALAYAHDKGVIHRDLKPANVMLGEHGEVQVMDWGLSKVIREGSVVTAFGAPLTKEGQLVGTPCYIAPEQVAGKELDHRADIYALGVILYELLTLTPPYTGSAAEVLAATMRDAPQAPRQRRAEIPIELEQLCLAALAKSPKARPGSAEVMVRAVQGWLETEADRSKRHERAEARAAQGRQQLAEYRRLKGEVAQLATAADAVAERFESWQPVAEKQELFAAQDAYRTHRQRLTKMATSVVATLVEALGFEDMNATARELLADYYWDRYLEAEARFEEDEVDYYGELVAQYHDGKYERELKGDGSLTLNSVPGAEVWLHRLHEEGPVLVERDELRLGTTPLVAAPLAMGSYVVVLKKEGYRDTRYPVCITRNKEWSGEVRLATDQEIGEGFQFVPGGPFVMGGDEEANQAGPRTEPWVDDVFLAEHPVTHEEYLEFLNDLVRTDGLEAAKVRAPRIKSEEPDSTYLVDWPGSSGPRLRLPEGDEEGDWHPRHPVASINWYDAVAYCEWRSRRDGRAYRLPTEQEWEKGARGVDARWYPWGWRFDASLCNMNDSRQERSSPVPVEQFPRDLSVYGVRGLGGNTQDWTSTEVVEGSADDGRVSRVLRGGLWSFTARFCRVARRFRHVPTGCLPNLGLRLARSRSPDGA